MPADQEVNSIYESVFHFVLSSRDLKLACGLPIHIRNIFSHTYPYNYSFV